MRRSFVIYQFLVVAVFLALLGGCKSNSSSYSSPTAPATTTPPPSTPNAVAIQNFAFGPASLTITKGATVTWKNNDNVPHTATSDDGSWDTGNIAPGGSKSLSFANAGSFAYHCTVHSMMKATLVVQ
jgi:plastocyanin